jgi:SAM-dependent methyltransferase
VLVKEKMLTAREYRQRGIGKDINDISLPGQYLLTEQSSFLMLYDVMSRKLLNRYIEYGRKEGYWNRGIAYRYQCRRQIFRGADPSGRKILDIGCGNGRFSIWAAVHGAEEVVGLEPTLEGSRSESVAQFRDAVDILGLENAEVREVRFQEFDSPRRYWDLVLMIASVNHLDEEACITLRESEESRRRYLDIFSRLYSVTAPGGRVVITDASSENRYAGTGEVNPYAPSIEWEKHQPPGVWAALLEEAGFVSPRISWTSPPKYLMLGTIFLSNYFYAYRRGSRFRLEVSRPE